MSPGEEGKYYVYIAAVSVSMVKEAKGWWDLEACSN
jgi:hypothetical protein